MASILDDLSDNEIMEILWKEGVRILNGSDIAMYDFCYNVVNECALDNSVEKIKKFYEKSYNELFYNDNHALHIGIFNNCADGIKLWIGKTYFNKIKYTFLQYEQVASYLKKLLIIKKPKGYIQQSLF